MRAVLFAISSLLLAASVSAKAENIVIIDDWWNVDYAKNVCESAKRWMADNRKLINQVGCASVTACPETMPTFTSCSIHDPTQEVRSFENQLTTEMAANPQCAGVSIARYEGPNKPTSQAVSDASNKPNWSLSINFGAGSEKQWWQLLHSVTNAYGEGEDTAKDLARNFAQS
jgi:hypothetical protein